MNVVVQKCVTYLNKKKGANCCLFLKFFVYPISHFHVFSMKINTVIHDKILLLFLCWCDIIRGIDVNRLRVDVL